MSHASFQQQPPPLDGSRVGGEGLIRHVYHGIVDVIVLRNRRRVRLRLDEVLAAHVDAQPLHAGIVIVVVRAARIGVAPVC